MEVLAPFRFKLSVPCTIATLEGVIVTLLVELEIWICVELSVNVGPPVYAEIPIPPPALIAMYG
jgi:hypothetical protein